MLQLFHQGEHHINHENIPVFQQEFHEMLGQQKNAFQNRCKLNKHAWNVAFIAPRQQVGKMEGRC